MVLLIFCACRLNELATLGLVEWSSWKRCASRMSSSVMAVSSDNFICKQNCIYARWFRKQFLCMQMQNSAGKLCECKRKQAKAYTRDKARTVVVLGSFPSVCVHVLIWIPTMQAMVTIGRQKWQHALYSPAILFVLFQLLLEVIQFLCTGVEFSVQLEVT